MLLLLTPLAHYSGCMKRSVFTFSVIAALVYCGRSLRSVTLTSRRHIKIRELKVLQTPAAKKILIEARKKALFLSREDDSIHEVVTTLVKTKETKRWWVWS